jgi:hypothetical protein
MSRLAAIVLTSALLLSASCVIAVVDPRYPDRVPYPRGELNRTLPLKSGGQIQLENSGGNIEILGWDEEQVDLRVVERTGPPPTGGIHISGWRSRDPKVDIQGSDETITIRTRKTGDKDEFRQVDFNLRVPRSIELTGIRNGRGNINLSDIYGSARIVAGEGDVEIRNFSGSLDVELKRGSLEAELLDLRAQDEIRIQVEEGDIIVYLETAVAAELEADAPGGEVTSEIDLALSLPAKTASAHLGEGQTKISLTALDGDIRIKKVKE